MDYSRAEILTLADAAIRKYGGPKRAEVFFKFSCQQCGERCTFNEPNVLWEVGECHACGSKTVVERAGFALHIATGSAKLHPTSEHTADDAGEGDEVA